MVDTVNPAILRRIFDPRIDSSFKELSFKAVQETYLIYFKTGSGTPYNKLNPAEKNPNNLLFMQNPFNNSDFDDKSVANL